MQRNAVGARAVDAHIRIGVAHMPHHQKAHIACHVLRGPAALGFGHHGVHRGQGAGHVGTVVGQASFGGLVFLVQLVQRVQLRVRDGKVRAAKNHQAREREDEVKWQRHYTREVVQIERATLRVLFGAEGEQLAEDLAVHHHAADQCHQHHQRRKTHDPGAQVLPVQVQAVVQRVEELAADLEVVIRQ
ncbi:hypothetical protein D3C72_1469080 [compost metagenome]